MKYKNIIFPIFLLLVYVSCKKDVNNVDVNNSSKETDELICEKDSLDYVIFDDIMNYSSMNNLKEKPLSDIELAIAKYFLGTPYVAKTLENEEVEHLVINLRGMDCTTFVENVVSFSKFIKSDKREFNDFCQILKNFRYHDGKIEGYPSRLHYFTDWLLDNEKKHLISIVSNSFGVDNYDSYVDFMSTHPQYYPKLKNDTFVKLIKEREKEISKEKFKFIPKEKLRDNENHIKDGDIIGITTSVGGLDIAHVGLAYFVNGRLHLFHASSKGGKVMISDKTLEDYLKEISKDTGIIVARLK